MFPDLVVRSSLLSDSPLLTRATVRLDGLFFSIVSQIMSNNETFVTTPVLYIVSDSEEKMIGLSQSDQSKVLENLIPS